ncbi:MAG: right-handed parallel beta-helix repeat-containing protein [Nocardioides sp.]
MRRSPLTAPLTVLALLLGLLALGSLSPASAHEERPATFPDGTGHRPTYLGLDNPRHRVVCTDSSAARVARMADGPLKRRNTELLGECRFHSIQTAINTITHRRTSVYVLPGRYTESRWANAKRSDYCSHLKTQSNAPLNVSEYIGSLSDPSTGNKPSDPIALSYADQLRCRHNLNLIAIMGDSTPRNHSIHCDSVLCGTQVVGTGADQGDVVIDNRFSKLNGIRADRAGGVYFKNFTIQQAEFNSLYVLETDGFVIDHVTARGNDEYGILAFASDHGLIQHTDDYFNGDSGIYPGSGSDINANNTNFKPIRYAIEIRYNRSHDNTLGYSGTAGNSIHAHDNRFFDNATGISTDSLFPGHPGLPQDHARWDHNRIYSNNRNWYTRYVDTGVCDKPMKERGYLHGTVCPVVPVPVGTGLLIAGGNYDSTDHNWIYDNWRNGTMQFWVPSPLRDEYDPAKLYDTSNHNHTFANHMGLTPTGAKKWNGLDHWWDDQGVGNCWEGNQSAYGTPTDNFTVPPPSCADGGSVLTPGLTVKDAGFLSCAEYDRSDPTFKHPPGCTWFNSPSKPTGRPSSGLPALMSEAPVAPAPDAGGWLALLGLGVLGATGLTLGRRSARR